MVLEMNIIQQRATIFISSFISYSPAAVDRYGDLIIGAQPVPVPQVQQFPVPMPATPISNLQIGSIWQLVFGQMRVVFTPNRVDVVKDWIGPRQSIQTEEFSGICRGIIGKILERERCEVLRVAYAPVYAHDVGSDFAPNHVWSRLLTKPEFDRTPAQEVSIVRNYRVVRLLGGKGYVMNYRSVVGDANRFTPDGAFLSAGVMVNLDINTVADNNYRFSFQEVSDFFAKSESFANELFVFLFDA